ncbi:MAG: transglutaminase domain-containing protein [Candidatus Heimdallarchaeaceae archaeon]
MATKVKKLKTTKRLKHKPAVVPKKTRKIKTKKSKLPITTVEEKKLKVKNIIFTIIFGALTVAAFFFRKIISNLNPPSDPVTELIITVVRLFLIGLFTYITLLSFETYKVKFHPKPLRILLTVITLIVFFPLTLFKYYTRHNVWRIIFVGMTIISLFMTFFGSYLTGVLYRDSLNGAEPDKNPIDTSFLSSPFIINLPVDIESFLDLLNNLGDLDDLTLETSVANITAQNGFLGNFLYRWDVYDEYNPDGWEFEKSNEATLYNIPQDERGEPSDFDSATDVRMSIQQSIYTATSGVDISLLSTWNSIYRPHIDWESDWSDNVRDLQGNSVGSSDTSIYYDTQDQLHLKTKADKSDPLTPFQGTFEYTTYFMYEDDIDFIMQNSLDYEDLDSNYIQSEYSAFLQAPNGYYDTISTAVTNFADNEIGSTIDSSTSVYDVVSSVIQNVLNKGNLENIFGATNVDTGGEDPANVLARNEDAPSSAYISLTVMALRRLGIPARPVMGFAVGSGTDSYREIKLANLYYWVEVLMPLDTDNDGSTDEYRWGQFQIGPYPVDETTFVFCDNSLNAQYDLNLEIFEQTPGDVRTMSSGEGEIYLVDHGVTYTIQVSATRSGNPSENVPITLKSYSASELQGGFSTSILSGGIEISQQPIVTDASGVATLTYEFTPENYSTFDLADQTGTTYFIVALNGLNSYSAKGIAIFPSGYLTDVVLNASKQTIPNPQNLAETKTYYLIQQGWKYEMFSYLYKEGPPGTDPLENRTVNYYLLTPEQLQDIINGASIDPTQFTLIGSATTDPDGNSSVFSVNETTQVDYFTSLTVNTTYAILAVYGFNYSYAPIVIIDGLIASVKVNDTLLDTGTDGYTMWEEINVTLSMQPPNGYAEPLADEDVWLWVVYETDWQEYDGSIDGTTYNSTLNSSTRSYYIGHRKTNSNGQIIENYLIDATQLGAGKFKIVAIYSERWEGSEDIFIVVGPALSVIINTKNTVILDSYSIDNGSFDFIRGINTYLLAISATIALVTAKKLLFLNKKRCTQKKRNKW